MTQYVRFDPPREVKEYRGQPGLEVGGLRLPWMALDALSESIVSGRPCELVVVGEYRFEDGSTRLDFGVPRYHIETTTHHRLTAHGFLWTCPSCGLHSGKHARSCDYS